MTETPQTTMPVCERRPVPGLDFGQPVQNRLDPESFVQNQDVGTLFPDHFRGLRQRFRSGQELQIGDAPQQVPDALRRYRLGIADRYGLWPDSAACLAAPVPTAVAAFPLLVTFMLVIVSFPIAFRPSYAGRIKPFCAVLVNWEYLSHSSGKVRSLSCYDHF